MRVFSKIFLSIFKDSNGNFSHGKYMNFFSIDLRVNIFSITIINFSFWVNLMYITYFSYFFSLTYGL